MSKNITFNKNRMHTKQWLLFPIPPPEGKSGSWVWEHYNVLTNNVIECVHCGYRPAESKKSSTTRLTNHLITHNIFKPMTPPNNPENPIYNQVKIPGKGRGLRASVLIPKDTIVFNVIGFNTGPAQFGKNQPKTAEASATKYLNNIVDPELRRIKADYILSRILQKDMYTFDPTNKCGDVIFHWGFVNEPSVDEISNVQSYKLERPDVPVKGGSHPCALYFIATKDIQPGEEIMWSYGRGDLNRGKKAPDLDGLNLSVKDIPYVGARTYYISYKQDREYYTSELKCPGLTEAKLRNYMAIFYDPDDKATEQSEKYVKNALRVLKQCFTESNNTSEISDDYVRKVFEDERSSVDIDEQLSLKRGIIKWFHDHRGYSLVDKIQ